MPETAVGDYGLEAVQAMDRIAREVERQRKGRSAAFDLAVGRRTGGAADRFAQRQARSEDAIAVAVCAASELLETRVIVCFTSSVSRPRRRSSMISSVIAGSSAVIVDSRDASPSRSEVSRSGE